MAKPIIIQDCPRCGAKKMTFDVEDCNETTIYQGNNEQGIPIYEYASYELFAVCRNEDCKKATVFIIYEKYNEEYDVVISSPPPMTIKKPLNNFFAIVDCSHFRDNIIDLAPSHVPEKVKVAFEEGATCRSVGCYSAAGIMFRKCLDIVTEKMLLGEGENRLSKGTLENKIIWLHDNNRLSRESNDLVHCIRKIGNDGAHYRMLSKEEADDLLEFTRLLLELTYTKPNKIKIRNQERENLRAG